MGGYPASPIVSGLLDGFSLASQMKQQALQQQVLQRQVQRDAEDKQVRDLQTQMALSDRGYKPSTPDQDAEAQTGLTAPKMMDVPGVIGQVQAGPPQKSDIKSRMAKFNGQTYVRPSQDELDVQAERQGARDLASKTATAKALADVAEASKVKGATDLLNATGVALSDQMSDSLGLPRGQKYPAEKLDDLMRAYTTKTKSDKGPAAQLKGYTNQDTGDVTPTVVGVDKDGKPMITTGAPAKGIAKSRTRVAQGGTRDEDGLTPYQRLQADRQKRADDDKRAAQHVKDQDTAQKQVNALNKQEQKFHDENRALGARAIQLGKGTATNKGKPYKPAAADRDAELAQIRERIGSNQAQAKALNDQAHGIIMRFAGGGAASGTPSGVPQNPYALSGAIPQNPYATAQ